ncbi:GNAT family N-acetyltransferase [Chloroflexota bacterium]
MKPEIRPMNSREKLSIIRILIATLEFKPAEITVEEKIIDCYLNNPFDWGYRIFIPPLESRIAGYICYGPASLTEGTWDIYWIVTAQERQRQGIGKALLALTSSTIKKAHRKTDSC